MPLVIPDLFSMDWCSLCTFMVNTFLYSPHLLRHWTLLPFGVLGLPIKHGTTDLGSQRCNWFKKKSAKFIHAQAVTLQHQGILLGLQRVQYVTARFWGTIQAGSSVPLPNSNRRHKLTGGSTASDQQCIKPWLLHTPETPARCEATNSMLYPPSCQWYKPVMMLWAPSTRTAMHFTHRHTETTVLCQYLVSRNNPEKFMYFLEEN